MLPHAWVEKETKITYMRHPSLLKFSPKYSTSIFARQQDVLIPYLEANKKAVCRNNKIKKNRKVCSNEQTTLEINLKQSDNILYACFVWTSLLLLGKSVGIFERSACSTVWHEEKGWKLVTARNQLSISIPKTARNVLAY